MRNDKDEQLAVECFSKAIRLKPGFSPANLSLVSDLVNEGQYAEGLVVADSLVKMVPRCAKAYSMGPSAVLILAVRLEPWRTSEWPPFLVPTNRARIGFSETSTANPKSTRVAAAAYEKAIARYEDESPANNDMLGFCYGRAGYAYIGTGKYQRA